MLHRKMVMSPGTWVKRQDSGDDGGDGEDRERRVKIVVATGIPERV